MHVVIRADASPALGMGHVYRALSLEHELVALGHEVDIAAYNKLGRDYLRTRSANMVGHRWLGGYDLIILDILDTHAEDVLRLQQTGAKVVTFEDLGGGGDLADLTINALYAEPEHAWTGPRNAILASCFEDAEPIEIRDKVERILIAFGGTDPARLTRLALLALDGPHDQIDVVVGPGNTAVPIGGGQVRVHHDVRDMAALMARADLAVTSAGRTVTELMSLGVPTIALCQNERELTHTHASGRYGVVNLGLGAYVTPNGFRAHIDALRRDVELRRRMHARMLEALRGRSNRAIVERILAAVEEG